MATKGPGFTISNGADSVKTGIKKEVEEEQTEGVDNNALLQKQRENTNVGFMISTTNHLISILETNMFCAFTSSFHPSHCFKLEYLGKPLVNSLEIKWGQLCFINCVVFNTDRFFTPLQP